MICLGVKDQVTEYYFIVDDYFNKKTLAKLGYVFNGDNLTDFEVQAYEVIAAEVAKLEKSKLK
jgi:DNA-binding transcriptional regulator of glucitol operon